MPKHFKLIACKIMERELSYLSYKCKNKIDVTYMRQLLHNTPKKLNKILQEEIDKIDENTHNYSNDTINGDYDAILMGYGLCSNITRNLSSKKYPIVIPRVHDCISLFMGSKEKYRDYYFKNPGTIFYTPGFIENYGLDEKEKYQRKYEMYLERYKGREKLARKALRIDRDLLDSHDKALYIKWDALEELGFEEYAKKRAKERSWELEYMDGDEGLLKRFLDGDWNPEEFQIVEPGERVDLEPWRSK